ncbi:retrotransposon protein, putative, ty1-copia subclass [Tanacetum coccineum]
MDTECHHCHKLGHWKRNCPLFLAELKKNKASTFGTSGIFTNSTHFLKLIPRFMTLVVVLGFCNTIQGLRGIRKLNKGALDLYVGNGNRVAVKAIRSFDLILPSGMVLVLDNFSKDNVFYFNDIPRDGIFDIDMHNRKRKAKLQHDGLLKSIDDESFDVCISCISGKMARKPFTHASERVDDLLGLIHSDVCGPFRTTSTLVDMVMFT